MKANFFSLIFFWMIGVLFTPLLAEDDKTVDAPWDTVMAEIQLIESLTQADSLKNMLMTDLFQRYQITDQDYRAFYADFLTRRPQQQYDFLSRVKAVLLEYIKRHYLPPGYKTFTDDEQEARQLSY